MKINKTPLGDLHNGKQTCLVQTENGAYIQKPRSAKTEEAFDLFCKKVEELGLFAFSRAPFVIEKSENEHTQKVEENSKTDEKGADLYYQRVGLLLFFTYLFASNDLHCENLIANGDMPVLVDLETLFTGKARGSSNTYNLSKSVMRTHLLCNFMSDKTGVADVSGLSGITAEYKNIVHTENGRVHLWDKKDVFISSFEKAYNFALSHKKELAELIHIFNDCEFRQLLRPTKTYATISAVVSKLSDDKKETYANALLAIAYEKDVDKNRLEKAKTVLQIETDSVLNGEIPLFYCFGNSVDLYSNGQKVLCDHLVLSPVDYALSRLDELSTEDLKRQKSIISLAVDASTPIEKSIKKINVNKGSLASGELTAQAVTECAIDGINSVFAGLISDKNGNVDFVSYNYSLYQGLSGVLCMYAALYRKTGKSVYKDCIYKYYEKCRQVFFGDNKEIILTDKNCSLGDGIIGVLASLTHISQLADDSFFAQDAKSLAERLTVSSMITNTDYLNGVGALPLILNKLNTSNRDDIFCALAPIFENVEPFTTGVAHGSSGLALSLCALGSNMPKSFDDKILSLLRWENEHYSNDDNNWFDLRDKSKKGFMSGWCSGAPGIAMARDYIIKHTDNINIKRLCQEDIGKAKTFLAKQTPSKKDVLCCGTSSRLMSASALDLSLDFTYNKLQCAEENNSLRLLHIAGTDDKNVSLMQGLAGVAYSLALYKDTLCGGMLIC